MNPTITDEALIRAVANGDTRAFAQLYDRHARTAYGLAYRICGSRQLAEDALQEAFLQLSRSASGFRVGEGAAAAWLLAIVRHRSLDAVRREATFERRRHDADDPFGALADTDPAPEDQAWACERERVIASALSQLPYPQRSVIELAFLDGLSQTQIAARLGIPLGTVKSRARLGLSRLAQDTGVLDVAEAG